MSHPGPKGCLAAALAATLALTAATAPAGAFQLFGIKFFEGKKDRPDEEPIGEPQHYSLGFTVAGGDRDVEKRLRGASTLYKDQKEPASGAAGLLAKARADYKRLLNALYADGRYGGTISITVDGREAANLAPDAAINEPAVVAVAVNPGPTFLFRQATIDNRAPPATFRRDKVDLPEDKGFRPGEIAKSGTIVQAGRLSVEAWRQQGHPKAVIAEQNVTAAHDQTVIDARLRVDPGRRAVYGPTSVKGTERMDPGFVAYMTGLPQGREYDPDDFKRANDRLARLDVFRSARIEEAEEIGHDGSLPIGVTVQERPLHRFGVGASYSTLDGAGFETYWLHRNLFGHAEQLRLEAKIAGIGSQVSNDRIDANNAYDPRNFTYRVGATFTKPGVFTPDTNFVASLIGEREVLEPYTRTAVTAQAGFTRIFTPELSGRLFVTGGPEQFEDDYGTRDFINAGFLGGLTYDTRDVATNATEGFYVDVTAEPFYEFEYGNPNGKLTAEGRVYYGFGQTDALVLAARLKLGTVVGPDIDQIAPDKLFFAGGGGSVRGYAYRNIGVEGPNGGVVGGKSLIEGSVEARFRVTNTIGLVGFVDAGSVGAESAPTFSEDLRVGVGVGLRYLTGLGPIRLDVAIPLQPEDDDPTVAFYVGIGQAF